MTEPCWYLYCVAEGPEAPAPSPGLTVHSFRNLHAVLEPVDPLAFAGLEQAPDGEIPPGLAELALRHDQVVRAVFSTHDVLPMRFATAVGTPESVSRYLAEHCESLQAQLARVRGHAEWGARWRRPTAATGSVPDNQAPASGRDYLRRRQQHLQAEQQATRQFRLQAERQHQALAALASIIRPGDQEVAGEITCSYLVAFDRQEAFTDAAATVARPDLAELHLTGPWPPYSFCAACTVPDKVT